MLISKRTFHELYFNVRTYVCRYIWNSYLAENTLFFARIIIDAHEEEGFSSTYIAMQLQRDAFLQINARRSLDFWSQCVGLTE